MTRYELAERIGSGGMAEIFKGKAIAAGGFEKPVAIKRILPHLSQDKRFVELLIAEANILSHLRHRNIVQIFDVGLGPDGQYFLVMEHVDGVDLGRMQASLEARKKRLPVDLGLHICSDVCEALEQAHTARGPDGEPMRLVHRDVSPSNVLLSRSGEVKLTDFGIAKRPEEVTGHGTVRGKFAYISPEQAHNKHVDARSDVFSVGILLWELLLGRRLFSGMADFDALGAVREARAPRMRQVDPAIDPRLDDIVARALARNPDDRFPSAGELGKELRMVRYSLPATSRDPAQELAGLVTRSAGPDALRKLQTDELIEEATVVRLNSAPGFSLSSSGDYDESRHRSYADARQILNLFEEEVTRNVKPADLGLLDRSGDDDDDATIDVAMDSALLASMMRPEADGGEEATVVGTKPQFAAARRAGSRAEQRPPAAPARPRHEGGAVRFQSEHAHTPAGATLDRDVPASSTLDQLIADSAFEQQQGQEPLALVTTSPYPRVTDMPPGAMPVVMAPAPYMPRPATKPPSRRKRWIAVGLAVAGTGLLSFVIAAAALNSSGQASSRVSPDAAPVDTADAGSPDRASLHDAGVEPDAATPVEQKKVTPTKKRTNKPKRTKKTTTKKTTTKKTTTKQTTTGKTTTKQTTTGKTTTGKTSTGKTTTGKTTTGKTTTR
jgi:eukaryotic-like serine/threonine-protein kinase